MLRPFRLALSIVWSLIGVSFLTAAEPSPRPIRVGVIGVDNYQCVAFTELFHKPPTDNPDLAGIRVVCAIPAGSPDIPESVDNLPKWHKRMGELGAEMVQTPAELLKRVDAVLIMSLDGRKHLEQVRPVLEAGKPVYIGRPMVASLADAVTIFDLATQHKTPVFSCSQHRFSPGFIGMRHHPECGDVLGAVVYGGCPREPSHPDLYWHAIHGVETLYTIMRPGCVSVVRTETDKADVLTGVWNDGRVGTFHGIREGAVKYSAIVFGSRGVVPAGNYGYAAPIKGVVPKGRYMGYEGVATEIARFFKTRTPPVSNAETLELFAFLEAAEQSKRQKGMRVKLADVLAQARARK